MDKNIDMKNKKNKDSSACVHSCFSAYNTDSNAVYPEAY